MVKRTHGPEISMDLCSEVLYILEKKRQMDGDVNEQVEGEENRENVEKV